MHNAALRYFLEVVRTGSITETSARLNIAASAISRQIAKLESELDTQLFERRSRRMVLSEAGELLAQHARRTFLSEEHVMAEIRRFKGLQRGLVRIGCTEGFGTEFVPRAVGLFRKTYPGIAFEIHVAAPREVARMVCEGAVDVGLSFGFAPDVSVRVELAGRAPLVAIMALDHPLAGQPEITLSDIAAYPVGLPGKETTARQLFDMICGVEGVLIEPVVTTNYMASLWSFAEAGDGILMTGRITALSRVSRFRIAVVPLRTRAANERRYEVQTMMGRVLPEAVSIFVAQIKRQLRELDPDLNGESESGDA